MDITIQPLREDEFPGLDDRDQINLQFAACVSVTDAEASWVNFTITRPELLELHGAIGEYLEKP